MMYYDTGKEGVASGVIENFKFLITDETLEQKLNVIHTRLLVSLCAKLGFT
jgi:hypothetical protein